MNSIIVLALGNDILGDDGVGFIASRLLKQENIENVDVVESAESGLALIDILSGYKKALILDAISTKLHSAGTILEFSKEDFSKVVAPSPHYAGLPEIFDITKVLEIPFPQEIKILAMEIEDPYQIKEGLSPTIEKAIPSFLDKAKQILKEWNDE